MIFFVAHVCACGFILVPQLVPAGSGEESWLEAQGLYLEQEPVQVYVNALYYCLITMSTIGYGDITPKSMAEKLYVIVMTQVACGVFAYAINTIGQIFYNMDQQEE